MSLDMSIRIGGQAGQGVQAVSHALGKVFTRSGQRLSETKRRRLDWPDTASNHIPA